MQISDSPHDIATESRFSFVHFSLVESPGASPSRIGRPVPLQLLCKLRAFLLKLVPCWPAFDVIKRGSTGQLRRFGVEKPNAIKNGLAFYSREMAHTSIVLGDGCFTASRKRLQNRQNRAPVIRQPVS